MQLGMTLAEYEHSVGPKNKRFHELAEAQYLVRDGVIQPDDDDSSAGSNGAATLDDPSANNTKVRWSTGTDEPPSN